MLSIHDASVFITRHNMAARMENFVRYFTLFLFLYTAKFVLGEECPQQRGDSSSRINTMARNLAGSGTFYVYDDDGIYLYVISLCKNEQFPRIAVEQKEAKNVSGGRPYNVGLFENAVVFGGADWLILQYTGAKYTHHCGGSERKALIYVLCDRSATTHKKRKPKIVEEYRTDTPKGKKEDFCYYLFEMKHDAVCPPEKTKISPGSVFIIIIVIVGVLYLVLGFLYQRFIVGAKGMEQLPNYLMWREFGTLQADGCNYMCRCQGARKPTRYKPVDDAIADDEDEDSTNNDDNDDTLLPM